MKLFDIAKLPTITQGEPTHESILQSYQLLNKVMDWLAAGVPNHIILELIDDIRTADICRSNHD